MIVNVYIDGFNLYHAIDKLKDNRLKWLDLKKLANTLIRQGESLGDVSFFTAVVTWDKGKENRHREYLAAARRFWSSVPLLSRSVRFSTPHGQCLAA